MSGTPCGATPVGGARTGEIKALGKCADIASNLTDGRQLQIWTCNGSGAQRWTLP
ncbi:ricin-type beta-trefoil lectin domain protein [Micromonospora cremea]|uniref:Uncharacterized protein n=1 Tax=Micromonospora cremea TaxID=709881 RepID=A0A1N6B8Q5_9ACTN|nr:ricin-type beta-trefoil lectin domain protein [Micromonospora cremea]SIN42646.1 hypothetical protein SAMN04489832_6927 [Micromonospora cremea]